jgi:hypothetical protein
MSNCDPMGRRNSLEGLLGLDSTVAIQLGQYVDVGKIRKMIHENSGALISDHGIGILQ